MPFPLLPLFAGMAAKGGMAAGLKAAAGTALKAGIGALGSRAFDAAGRKVFGVPTPDDPLQGSDRGLEQLEYMDTAFPGTTPWERLGASGSGNASQAAADVSARSAQYMQRKELSNARSIARDTNRASIISSTAGLGPVARDSSLGAYDYGPAPAYDTPVQQGREKVDSEKHRNRYGSVSSAVSSGAKNFYAKSVGPYINSLNWHGYRPAVPMRAGKRVPVIKTRR